jgi:hypothetical protein
VVVTSRMGDNVSNDELQTLAAKVEALTTKVKILAAEGVPISYELCCYFKSREGLSRRPSCQ